MTTMTRTARPSAPPTRHAASADGTRIAYETLGEGVPLVLVDGAMCHRAMGHARPLAAALTDRFAVTAYDRRGRHESDAGRTPYAVDRELEDLAAVVDAVGGRAHLFGASSGAALALTFAGDRRFRDRVDRLVAYEAPFRLDDSAPALDPDLGERTRALVEDGRTDEAMSLFFRLVGVPAPARWMMRALPVWRTLRPVAATLPHDYAIVLPHQQGRPLPDGLYDDVAAPTLVLAGAKSPAPMRAAQAAVVAALPHGRLEELPGQTHLVKAAATAPAVARHLQEN